MLDAGGWEGRLLRHARSIDERTSERNGTVALKVHCAFLPVYVLYALVGAALASSEKDRTPFAVAFVMFGVAWLVVALMLISWWSLGRRGLVAWTVAWDLVAWLAVFTPLLFLSQRMRRLLIPPKAP
jgi:Na+-driven multidrug efflux pump